MKKKNPKIKQLQQNLQTLVEQPKKILRIFSLGALLFFFGLGAVQYANYYIQPSIQQEIAALLGLLVLASGFLTAIVAQLLLIWHRFDQVNKR